MAHSLTIHGSWTNCGDLSGQPGMSRLEFKPGNLQRKLVYRAWNIRGRLDIGALGLHFCGMPLQYTRILPSACCKRMTKWWICGYEPPQRKSPSVRNEGHTLLTCRCQLNNEHPLSLCQFLGWDTTIGALEKCFKPYMCYPENFLQANNMRTQVISS